jgi:hypothetical protein
MTDLDNPVPEPSHRWRRWVTIGYLIVTAALLAFIVYQMTESAPLRDVALALIGSQAFFALLYMAGASAADLARIVASWKKP